MVCHAGLASLLVLVCAFPHEAKTEDKPIKIGVLSFRSHEQTLQQWQPLADYLEQTVSGHRFEIEALYYPEMDEAAQSQRLDFVFTNPEHYVLLRNSMNLAAMATMMPVASGHPVNQFGGVIFTRSSRNDINSLDDLAHKTIASPSNESLGGFMMQQWELYKKAIPVGDYLFTGMPHDLVLEAVAQGKADAGFVRTGVVEHMALEGKIDLSQIKFLNRQQAVFPQILSTALYPEWPFAAPSYTDASLVKAVTLALLAIENEMPVARQSGIFGFSPPSDYSKVEALMLNLNVHPEKLKNLSFLDFYYRYRLWIWLSSSLLVLSFLFAIKLAGTIKQLRRANLQYHLLADGTNDWVYWLDPAGKVVYMSASCVKMTGYSAEAFMQRPELLFELVHPEDRSLFDGHWRQHSTHTFSGELEFRVVDKQQNVHWIHHLCRPVIDEKNRFRGIQASNRDITERKQIEEKVRHMAFHDPLTQLANRRLLQDRLQQTIHTASRSRLFSALLFIDLDRFKPLNDEYGHDVGDILLQEVAKRLTRTVRLEDTVARLGGDEFVVLLVNLDKDCSLSAQFANRVAQNIHDNLMAPYELRSKGLQGLAEDIVYRLTVSIGISVFLDEQKDADMILKQGDLAMYDAKSHGRNAISCFNQMPT